ncbi:MAG: hypothetical protein RBG13Loki_2909 [Promethearchaeota archaeon CR_4]|nr:MAG: hypothetical protein RBG13Loki_2909 [Candidatus Lokiarchaeota archaeon CR_4]
MLRSLYDRLAPDHEMRITARDFDSTYALLNAWNKPYLQIGKHGGNTLMGKLRSYSDRLVALIEFAEKEKPDFLFGLASPEGLRVSFGLQIPNIIFNDEPRSTGVVKLSLPFAEHLIVPEPIPVEWFTQYGIAMERIHRFHGIDEVAETVYLVPDPNKITKVGLAPEQYVICRPEQTAAQYHMKTLGEGDTKLPCLLDPLIKEHPNLTYIIVPRNISQRRNLEKHYKGINNIKFFNYLDPIEQFLYHAKFVVCAGGSFVRQSALMNVPSVEYFPLGLYPQERFLIENGFPLQFLRDPEENPNICIEAIEKFSSYHANLEKTRNLENPIDLAMNLFQKGSSA